MIRKTNAIYNLYNVVPDELKPDIKDLKKFVVNACELLNITISQQELHETLTMLTMVLNAAERELSHGYCKDTDRTTVYEISYDDAQNIRGIAIVGWYQGKPQQDFIKNDLILY